MRIFMVTAGSRGDVEPFVALARRAMREGHDVRLGVTRDFVDTATAAGVDAVALDGDYAQLVADQGVSPVAAIRSFRTTIVPMMAALLRSSTSAALDFKPDVIVNHPKVLSAALAAARLDIPHVLCEIVPVVSPTREFPAAGVTTVDLGPFNRWTYAVTGAANRMFATPLGELRSELGLPARGALPGPVRSAVPVSPHLLPRPADWPDTTRLTGPWHEPDPTARLDTETAAFLEGGDAVYVGFGSMAAGDPQARGRAVIGALRAAGRRALVATGWGGIAVPDDLLGADLLVCRAVPHGAALPLCSAAVHHGGAGTVHAAVRAGLPSLVVPFLADQPFWGALLHRRGLGAPPVKAKRLTAGRFAAALRELPDPAAVRTVGAKVAAEDGCGAALRLLAEVV